MLSIFLLKAKPNWQAGNMNLSNNHSLATLNEKSIDYRRTKNKSCQQNLFNSVSPQKQRTIEKTKQPSYTNLPNPSLNKINKVFYQPYTLRDYSSKFPTTKDKYVILGGLGANRDEKWESAISSLQKRKIFGSVARVKNEQHKTNKLGKLLKKNKEMLKKNNARWRALEFAKTIRK
jgi:hypothetical protein